MPKQLITEGFLLGAVGCNESYSQHGEMAVVLDVGVCLCDPLSPGAAPTRMRTARLAALPEGWRPNHLPKEGLGMFTEGDPDHFNAIFELLVSGTVGSGCDSGNVVASKDSSEAILRVNRSTPPM